MLDLFSRIHFVVAREVSLLADAENINDLRQSDHQTGTKAAHQKGTCGNTHNTGVHHYRGRGRDQRRLQGRAGRKRNGEVLIVALFSHRLDLDHTESGNICDRRAGNRAENCAGNNIYKGQAALKTANKKASKVEQL